MRFHVTLHATPEGAARARSEAGALAKRFLPEGGVIWPVISDPITLDGICEREARRAQPGFYEICRAYSQHGRDQDEFSTEPVVSGASGFAITGVDGLARVVTNYHVVREAIERCQRTGGVNDRAPRASRDLWAASALGPLAGTV